MQEGGIDLEDAIDLRQIKNLKLANQMLKIKRKAKAKQEKRLLRILKLKLMLKQLPAEKIAMSGCFKKEAISGSKVQFEQASNQMEMLGWKQLLS